jgi:hypothetical protein
VSGETEASMYRLLADSVCKDSGNGPNAVIAPSVRSAAGFDARRTIDAVALGLWPSRGMLLDGYEIKVSRSDWLRELKNPAKAEEFAGLVDRLWLVVSDAAIVKDGELPDGWGLLVKSGERLRAKVKAQRLTTGNGLPPRFGRSFLVPLLRAMNAVPPDMREALREEAERQVSVQSQYDAEELAKLREQVEAFEKGAGIKIQTWRYEGAEDVEERGRAFAAALEGEKKVHELRATAARIAESAERLKVNAEQIATPTQQKETP